MRHSEKGPNQRKHHSRLLERELRPDQQLCRHRLLPFFRCVQAVHVVDDPAYIQHLIVVLERNERGALARQEDDRNVKHVSLAVLHKVH